MPRNTTHRVTPPFGLSTRMRSRILFPTNSDLTSTCYNRKQGSCFLLVNHLVNICPLKPHFLIQQLNLAGSFWFCNPHIFKVRQYLALRLLPAPRHTFIHEFVAFPFSLNDTCQFPLTSLPDKMSIASDCILLFTISIALNSTRATTFATMYFLFF